MKRFKIFLVILLVSVLLLQFASIPVGGTHLKPYMFVCIAFFFMLVLSKGFYVHKFQTHEILWILTYCLSTLSIVYAQDTQLAIQLVLGQCILLLFYVIIRFLFSKNVNKDAVLFNIFSFFVYASYAFYFIGCVQVFVFGNTSIFFQYLNEHTYRVWGCYFEGDTFPRFMGLSESPNNYVYFANVMLWWSVWKRKTTLAYATFISLILTVSTTAMVVLSIQGLLYCIYFKKGISWKVIIVLPLLAYLGYEIYLNNEFVQNMVEVRTVRNSTGSGRFELWDVTMKHINERPLLGYGINQFRAILPQTGLASSHNNILETLFSTGLIGCFLYVSFLLSFFFFSLRLSRFYKDPFFMLICTAFIVFGMANNTLTIEFVPFLLALTISYYSDWQIPVNIKKIR